MFFELTIKDKLYKIETKYEGNNLWTARVKDYDYIEVGISHANAVHNMVQFLNYLHYPPEMPEEL